MSDLKAQFERDGYVVFAPDPRVSRWADAARIRADEAIADPQLRREWLRHGETWFVGVDALPNGPDGSVDGLALAGPWDQIVEWQGEWHPAQVSALWRGYPMQDADESDAAHRFRKNRDAAHLDGLRPDGPDKRRHLLDPHAFILGLPLSDPMASPLVVWPGSHHQIMDMMRAEVGAQHLPDVDVTDAYQAARKRVFETCERVELHTRPGQALLMHRALIHGIAPWVGEAEGPRVVAYFRPEFESPNDWLTL